MTGDGKAIGTKHGIAFEGKWVWNMKDYIDRNFMKLFDPNYLFKDYQTMGYAHPLEKNELFEDESSEERKMTDEIKREVYKNFDHIAAVDYLMGEEDSDEFFEQFYILDRMGKEEDFCRKVVDLYRKVKKGTEE